MTIYMRFVRILRKRYGSWAHTSVYYDRVALHNGFFKLKRRGKLVYIFAISVEIFVLSDAHVSKNLCATITIRSWGRLKQPTIVTLCAKICSPYLNYVFVLMLNQWYTHQLRALLKVFFRFTWTDFCYYYQLLVMTMHCSLSLNRSWFVEKWDWSRFLARGDRK